MQSFILFSFIKFAHACRTLLLRLFYSGIWVENMERVNNLIYFPSSKPSAFGERCHVRQIERVIAANKHQLLYGDFTQGLGVVQLQGHVVIFKVAPDVL